MHKTNNKIQFLQETDILRATNKTEQMDKKLKQIKLRLGLIQSIKVIQKKIQQQPKKTSNLTKILNPIKNNSQRKQKIYSSELLQQISIKSFIKHNKLAKKYLLEKSFVPTCLSNRSILQQNTNAQKIQSNINNGQTNKQKSVSNLQIYEDINKKKFPILNTKYKKGAYIKHNSLHETIQAKYRTISVMIQDESSEKRFDQLRKRTLALQPIVYKYC